MNTFKPSTFCFITFTKKSLQNNRKKCKSFCFPSSALESIKGTPRQQEAEESARNNPGAGQLHEQRDEGERLRLQVAEFEQNNRH